MWVHPDGDSHYTGIEALRYRTSNNGGTGWGHWQTGGTLVHVDGGVDEPGPSRIRQLADGTYQLFYLDDSHINLATGTDGVNFQVQVIGLLDVVEILPISNIVQMMDFAVVDVEGQDWFYFTYCGTSAKPQCQDSRIAVSRPFNDSDLTITKSVIPTTVTSGDPLTYTLTFSNAGRAVATDVVITDIVPITLTNLTFTHSGATITPTGGTTYSWQVADLLPKVGGVITITGLVSPLLTHDSHFTNTALITSTTVDTDTTSNKAKVGLTVNTPRLVMKKTVIPTDVTYHRQVTYTLVLTNNGTANAINTLVTDTLPLSTTFARWVTQPTGASVSSGQITWNGMVTAGKAITCTFVADYIGDYNDVVTNVAKYGHISSNGSAEATFTVGFAPPDPIDQVYLPTIMKSETILAAPDLIVDSLIAASNVVTVVIKNIGNAPVTDAFWVDVYLDPNPAPTGVNQPWWQLSSQGLVWGVTESIPVSGTLTLISGGRYYSEKHSHFSGTLASGTEVWAQVDSVNLNTSYGGCWSVTSAITSKGQSFPGPLWRVRECYHCPTGGSHVL